MREETMSKYVFHANWYLASGTCCFSKVYGYKVETQSCHLLPVKYISYRDKIIIKRDNFYILGMINQK